MNNKIFEFIIDEIPIIGILAFSFAVAEPLSINLKGLQEAYIVTASMITITMILTYRIFIATFSEVSDLVISNQTTPKKVNKVIPTEIGKIKNVINKRYLQIVDLNVVDNVYKEANNIIEDNNNKNNFKDLSDFDIALIQDKEEKKEEIEKIKKSIRQFVSDKFIKLGIQEKEVINLFIDDIYKFNELRDKTFINEVKLKNNIPHKKLAEISHYAGKSLKWNGNEIAIFTKEAFKESFRNWELESIKGIASSELANKKSKK